MVCSSLNCHVLVCICINLYIFDRILVPNLLSTKFCICLYWLLCYCTHMYNVYTHVVLTFMQLYTHFYAIVHTCIWTTNKHNNKQTTNKYKQYGSIHVNTNWMNQDLEVHISASPHRQCNGLLIIRKWSFDADHQ